MARNPFPRIEVLPHPVEVALDTAQKAGSYVMRLIRNTNVQLPTMLPPETDLKTSEHIRKTYQPQLPFEGRLRDYDY